MIEEMFPQTVSNILDYDVLKAAAKKYVEDVLISAVNSFGANLVIQSMDEEHLAIVSRNVAGTSMTADELLDYINEENVYHEYDFVTELYTAFPNGVVYKEFEVTGYGFPESDFAPFNSETRSSMGFDEVWEANSVGDTPENNLLMSRFGRQFVGEVANWHRVSGRRASWGSTETWMTTGGFGKPASIHINVDEERTVIDKNGLTNVENWLGTVSEKLPINLYIEINDNIYVRDADDDVSGVAGSTDGYAMSFPYEEEESICTNDPDWQREVYYEGEQAFDNKGNTWTVIPEPQPEPEPEPGPDPGPGPEPEPEPSGDDFTGQGITGTYRVWGSEPTTGISFDDVDGAGNVVRGQINRSTLPYSRDTSAQVGTPEFLSGGIVDVDE